MPGPPLNYQSPPPRPPRRSLVTLLIVCVFLFLPIGLMILLFLVISLRTLWR